MTEPKYFIYRWNAMAVGDGFIASAFDLKRIPPPYLCNVCSKADCISATTWRLLNARHF